MTTEPHAPLARAGRDGAGSTRKSEWAARRRRPRSPRPAAAAGIALGATARVNDGAARPRRSVLPACPGRCDRPRGLVGAPLEPACADPWRAKIPEGHCFAAAGFDPHTASGRRDWSTAPRPTLRSSVPATSSSARARRGSGSRSSTTSPIERVATRDRRGNRAQLAGSSKRCSQGGRHARPGRRRGRARREGRNRVRLDRRSWVDAGLVEDAVDDAPVLHVVGQQAERHPRGVGPARRSPPAEWSAGGGQQHVALGGRAAACERPSRGSESR